MSRVDAVELKALWKLALPLSLAQAGQALMGMVDTAVLGQVDAATQAGAGLGNSLIFTCSFFGMGVMLALDPLVSQAIGANDEVRARNAFWQSVWLAGLTSLVVILAAGALSFGLPHFKVVPAVAAHAQPYMWWRLLGVGGLLLFTAARSYLTGVGNVAITFWAMVIANLANVALDWALVFGVGPIPALGVTGAALATVLCTYLQLAVLAFGFPPFPPASTRRFNRAEVLRMVRLGAPIGLHFVLEGGVFSLVGLLASQLSEVAGAAHQVALNWASLSFCVAVGIGSAAATRVGWGIGRGDTPAARRSGTTGFFSVVVFMAGAALGFLLFPEPLAALMSKDAAVRSATVSLFLVVAVFQIFDGLQAVGAGALRGLGITGFTFGVNLVGHWLIGLPVAWWLGLRGDHGLVGLWWGLSVGLMVVGVGVVLRFLVATARSVEALR